MSTRKKNTTKKEKKTEDHSECEEQVKTQHDDKPDDKPSEKVETKKWDECNTETSEDNHDVSRQTRPSRKSISNFDYDEIRDFDKTKLAGISNVELLKVLIVRGADELNPPLRFGARNMLKRLNGERVNHPRPREFQRGGQKQFGQGNQRVF